MAAVEKDYPSAAVRNATSDATVKKWMEFNEKWLKSAIAACSPNTNAMIVDEMRKIKFVKHPKDPRALLATPD